MPEPLLQGAQHPVRVLRVFSRLNVGGPSIHVLLLTEGLRRHGYETLLVVGREAPSEGNLLDVAVARGVPCLQLGCLGREVRPGADLVAFVRLFRLMRSFSPAIVHTHTAKAGLLGRLAARLARVPYVVHTYHGHVLHGYFGPLRTTFYRGLERALARGSDVLVAVSDAVKRDLVALGVAPACKLRVIPLGLELQPLCGPLPRGALRGPAGVPDAAPLVGMVGRLVPIKDVSTFLRAAARLRAWRPDVRFAVVGDGEARAALEAEARRLGLGSAVVFHGWQRDMRAVFGDLDVVVNTSRNEGTPVSLIEALAAGRPVVATRVGGNPDLIGPEARGFLVPPGSPEELAATLAAILEDPAEAQRRAAEGRAYVLARHSSQRLLRDVADLYAELLGEAAPAEAA